MANINAPFGFRPVMHINGSPYNGQANLYVITTADSTYEYHIGDLVFSSATADANGVPGVLGESRAAKTTSVPRGVIVGILGAYPGVSLVGAALNLEQPNYVPIAKSHDYYVMVADAPDLICEIQADTTSAATYIAAGYMLHNFGYTSAAPSPVTNPLSATVLTSASAVTTATITLKAHGLVRDPMNAYGAYAKMLVSFNLHELGNASGTTAI